MPATDQYILDVIKDAGMVRDQQVQEAMSIAQMEGIGVVEALIKLQRITHAQITQALAAHSGMETISLKSFVIPDDVIKEVPRHVARRYKVIPVAVRLGSISIAISDPTDLEVVDNLHYLLKREVEPMVATKEDIEDALARYYGNAEETVTKMLQEISEGNLGAELDVAQLTDDIGGEVEDETGIIKLVHKILLKAYQSRASDIHIEPLEKRLRIRFRIDGDLQEVDNPPKRLQASILSRTKIMASMDIAEKRVPQDGRIQVKMPDRTLDLRVSTVPSVHGESIVMRILDKSSLKLGLPELGFFSDDQARFENLIALPDGILLVTGPTGSGKTTTLYACLSIINRPDRKIITCEDPVEYELAGINQVAVNEAAGMTFSGALRAMLRQAPNIIMIGEIRDLETASIAVNASLTGHLVFSTLHTNDAPSAVTRLVDIGVKPFLVSSSVRAIMAQRLVRKICSKCKVEYVPTEGEVKALRLPEESRGSVVFYKGVGCRECNGSGYRGRGGIFEIFVIDDEVRRMITEKVPSTVLRKRARELGMRTLREDGIRKVLSGYTTSTEVIAVSMADET